VLHVRNSECWTSQLLPKSEFQQMATNAHLLSIICGLRQLARARPQDQPEQMFVPPSPEAPVGLNLMGETNADRHLISVSKSVEATVHS